MKEGIMKIGADNAYVKLKDVYHIPGLKKNLVSVSQLRILTNKFGFAQMMWMCLTMREML